MSFLNFPDRGLESERTENVKMEGGRVGKRVRGREKEVGGKPTKY